MILPTSIMWSPSSSKSKWSSIPSSSWSTVSGHENIDVTSTILIIKLYMIAPTCPGLTAEQQSYEQADIIHGHAPPKQYCLRKLGHSARINNNVTLQFKLGCHWPSLCEGVQRITWLLNLAFLWFRWQLTSSLLCILLQTLGLGGNNTAQTANISGMEFYVFTI